MGFWHTGYEGFHEQSGFGDAYVWEPCPIKYYCKGCGGVFSSPDDLQSHRFAAHSYLRPTLFIRGTELGNTPYRLTNPPKDGDIDVAQTDQVRLNGNLIYVDQLQKAISHAKRDTFTIELSNSGSSASFILILDFAAEADLAAVDQCFLDVARGKRLDMRAVSEFIESCKKFPSAMGYCDGISEYFIGCLAKEGTDSSLPYAMYREKFNRAAHELADFDRPLSRAIRGLIQFHFNHFADCAGTVPSLPVGAAAARFQAWLSDTYITGNRIPPLDSSLERLLTDSEAMRIIEWCNLGHDALLNKIVDIESFVHTDISELDRVKLHILLAETYAAAGDLIKARKSARELANEPTFGAWAARHLSTQQL